VAVSAWMGGPSLPDPDSGAAATRQAVANRYLVLAILTVVYTLNVLDRYILGVLLPQIKVDLAVNDTYLGVLTGAGFAAFYATLGIPLASLADRTSRKAVIAVSLALFSLMTAICGFAKSFTQLFVARIGVAAGEAGTSPPSFSIISDYFAPRERSKAMAIFTVGANAGVLLGFTLGGLIATRYGWRAAFFIVGIPGLIMVLLVAGLVREPRRGLSDPIRGQRRTETGAVSLRETLAFLWSQKALRHLLFGASLVLFVSNGVAAWLPSFLLRSHGMAADKSGIAMGLSLGIGGIVGTLACGGVLVERLSRRDLRWRVWIVAIAALSSFVGNSLVLNLPSAALAMAAFVIPATLNTVWQPPTLAMIQTLAPINMRATAGACLVLVGNLIGLGLGPLTIGGLSDLYAHLGAGPDSLRLALLSTVPVSLWAAVHFLLAARTLRSEYAKADLKNAAALC
jgi:MFS family permease